MGRITVRYLIENIKKGTVYRYWRPKPKYLIAGEWKKCPFPDEALSDDPIKAYTRAEQLNKALDEWRTGGNAAAVSPEGSFDWLIVEYKKSAWFKNLGDRTRKEYGYVLEDIRVMLREKALSAIPAQAIDRQMARAMHNAFASKPRKAQLVVALSRIVFNYGEETGVLPLNSNPFKDMRIKRNKPRQQTWLDLDTPDALFHRVIALKEAAIAKELHSMAFAIDLALFSLQREGDIIRLAWNKYDGAAIRLRQGKTGKWVVVPMRIPVFKDILDRELKNKTSPNMLISERTGKPYTKDHFGDVFREIRKDAGQPDELQYRDFRRTGIVLWGMSGAEPQQIAAVSGHDIQDTCNILETYMPKNIIMAQDGMDKVNVKYGEQLRKIQIGLQMQLRKGDSKNA